MEVKNIIFYDDHQHVSGFAELKVSHNITQIKVRHNIEDNDLLFSIITDGEDSNVFALGGLICNFELRRAVDLSSEVYVCVLRRAAGRLITLASGVINPDRKNIFKRLEIAKEVHDKLQTANAKQVEVPNNMESLVSSDEKTTESNLIEDIKVELEEMPTELSESTALEESQGYEIKEAVALKEIDEVLRAVCKIDEHGKGVCESCPYRDYFYRFTLESEIKNNLKELTSS